MMNLNVNRKYKERLFLKVFQDSADLLSLYNAVNGTSYTNPDKLEITTIEDVIYMGIKNDVSFMIGNVLNLWEHQSSYNPNMPIRGLSYFSKLYQKYIDKHNINVYSSALKRLPLPQYIVFYNGRKDEPDRVELRLSDAYIRTPESYAEESGGQNGSHTGDSAGRRGYGDREPCLELKAIMLNINYGKNRELMEHCRRLKEYAQFICQVREFQEDGLPIESAVEAAMDRCIVQGILADILSEYRAEVIEMFLADYDEEYRMKIIMDDMREELREEVRGEVREEVRGELREEVRGELREEVRGELREEVRGEVRNEALKEGRQAGIEEGELLLLISLVRKKLVKGVAKAEIADMLEADADQVELICGQINEHPDWDDTKVCEVVRRV